MMKNICRIGALAEVMSTSVRMLELEVRDRGQVKRMRLERPLVMLMMMIIVMLTMRITSIVI